VYKLFSSFFLALITGSVVGSAFAADVRNDSSCEASRPVEQHRGLAAGQRHPFSPAAHVRNFQNVHSEFNARGDNASDRARPADAPRDTDQPGKLALLENAPMSLKDSPNAAATRPDQTWVRLSDKSNVPEPGSWAVLLAGFLGICAVARPRIFSS